MEDVSKFFPNPFSLRSGWVIRGIRVRWQGCAAFGPLGLEKMAQSLEVMPKELGTWSLFLFASVITASAAAENDKI